MSNELIKNEVAEFVALVQHGIECWVKAGQLVSARLDRDPDWAEQAVAACPGLTMETIQRFDAIGRGQLVPKLMLANCPGYRALARQPADIQKRYIEHPLPVATMSDHGCDVLNISVENLTREQCKQVFSNEGVRTPEQQRAWLESKRTQAKLEEPVRPLPEYFIRGRCVHIQRPIVLTEQELARLLTKIVGG